MAIAQAIKPTGTPKEVYQRPSSVVPHKPVAVDTKYEPRRHLLTHVSGAKWTVNYYKQIKTKDEASEAFNFHRPLPYQQYLKIENFELRVQSPLTSSPNDDESTHSVQGTAIIYPSIVPDHGDLFIADIGDGRVAHFNIRNVTQKSHLRDSAYEIEYDLVDYVTVDLLKVLEDKVVKHGYYERDYASYGANPVLDVEQHGHFKRIVKWQEQITRHYFDTFYNHEYNTFLVPVEGTVLYDPFIVEFLEKLWPANIFSDMQYVKVYNRDTADNKFIKTIWDVIINNDKMMLAKCSNEFGAIPKQFFPTKHAGLMGLRYSRLDNIYHPIKYTQKYGVFELLGVGPIDLSSIYDELMVNRKFTLQITKLPGLGFVHHSLRESTPIPDANKFGTFDTYVLSPAFYKGDKAGMSKIERILTDVLDEKPINANELLPILDDIINWGMTERFYYIPLLVALSRSALGDLSQ